MLISPSCLATLKKSWPSNMRSNYGSGAKCESMRSVNDVSERSTRHTSNSCAKCGRHMSEQSARSRRLVNRGIARRGGALHARRCAGER